MLSLNRQMHKWWSMCYFAFKCLGITPYDEGQSTIHLQFHWMPRLQEQLGGRKGKNKGKKTAGKDGEPWMRKINLDNGEGQEMVDD